jgi:hypothetical protein
LSEHAAFLEERGDQEDVETFWNGVPKLLTEYIELTDRLKAIYQEHEVATDEDSLMEITPDELKDAYSAIEECTISLDYDSIEQILNELAGYKLSDEDKKKIALIKKGLAAVDNDRIIKAIKAE